MTFAFLIGLPKPNSILKSFLPTAEIFIAEVDYDEAQKVIRGFKGILLTHGNNKHW